MRHISSTCGLRRKDVFVLLWTIWPCYSRASRDCFRTRWKGIASSAGQAMFGSVQTVQQLIASIRALYPVDRQNESKQEHNDG
jgi:hypothetical protein